MYLSQVLDPDHSCRAAVARLIVWLALNDREPCSPETNSYSDARQRLPLEVIVELVHQTARKIAVSEQDNRSGSDKFLINFADTRPRRRIRERDRSENPPTLSVAYV